MTRNGRTLISSGGRRLILFHHLGKEIMARLFKLFLLHLFFFLGASVFTSKEEVDQVGDGEGIINDKVFGQGIFAPSLIGC